MASKFGIDIVVVENPMDSSCGRAVSAFAVVQEVRKAKKVAPHGRDSAPSRRRLEPESVGRDSATNRRWVDLSLWRSETASDHGVTGQPRRTGSRPGA